MSVVQVPFCHPGDAASPRRTRQSLNSDRPAPCERLQVIVSRSPLSAERAVRDSYFARAQPYRLLLRLAARLSGEDCVFKLRG